MNVTEFNDWYQSFADHFPETAEWMEQKGEKVRATWQKALADVRLDDAKRATVDLHRGDIGPVKGPSDCPKIIRAQSKLARRERAKQIRYSGGERSYLCSICLDTGGVPSIRTEYISQLLRGVPWGETTNSRGGKDIRECVALCTCDAGQKRVAGAPGWLVYDPQRHFRDMGALSLKNAPEGLQAFLDAYPKTQEEIPF